MKQSQSRGLRSPAKRSTDDSMIAIGQIVGPHGVVGEARVYPLTDFPERFYNTKSVVLGVDGPRVCVESARPTRRLWLLKLAGIDDRASVVRLKHTYLYISREETVRLPEDVFYVWQLIGLRVKLLCGDEVGTVIDVQTGCGNDLLIVRTNGESPVYIPFVREFVRTIDIAHGEIFIEPIPGLIEQVDSQ